MPPHSTPLIVAILGRPNVGKSTLFNRYAGRRRALVEGAPGLTRDRIVEEVSVGRRRVLVVDTAGLEPEATTELPAAIQAQARAAVEEADAILFVVDGSAGLLPQDEEIARELRRTAKPLVVAVNKIDAPVHAERVADFHRLGFERIRPLSAEHGSGAWDALEELTAQVPETALAPEADAQVGAVRVALAGRPNVGKSSLLNRLAGQERVVVSAEPGTTRDAVDLRIEREGAVYVFVDTAGLRRAGHRDRFGERGSALMTIRSIERAEVALVLVDAAEGFTEQDARIAGLVRQRGCAAAVVVNKWDLVEGKGEESGRKVRAEMERRLRFMADAPVLTVSAKTGTRLERLFPLAGRLASAARRTIGTAELNRWLQRAVQAHEPAMAQRGSRRRPLKFFYAAQTGTRPPTFVLFCSEPQSVQESYRRYLEKRLRESFDLHGAALRLRLRARRERAPTR
jgi:GTP-binding protein